MHRQGIRKRKEGNQWKDDVEPDLIEPPIIQEDIQREDFDSKEVEKINARLLEKDLKRTKRVVEDHSSKEAETSTHGLSQLLNDPKARKEYVSQLRERSRQNYLNPREAQILELSRQRIETEAIFGDLALTEAEMKRTEIEKSIYNLAAERRNIDLKPQLYQMPESTLFVFCIFSFIL